MLFVQLCVSQQKEEEEEYKNSKQRMSESNSVLECELYVKPAIVISNN